MKMPEGYKKIETEEAEERDAAGMSTGKILAIVGTAVATVGFGVAAACLGNGGAAAANEVAATNETVAAEANVSQDLTDVSMSSEKYPEFELKFYH